MLCRWIVLGAAVFVGLGPGQQARAQETSSDWAWNSILKTDGVEFFYIFYREADTHNNGVVLKIVNWNDYPVRYRFRVVFRAGDGEAEERVDGRLDARTMVTGNEAGLFFIPFRDGRSIGELGLKGYRIVRLPEAPQREDQRR
jgi:hypothetical protein